MTEIEVYGNDISGNRAKNICPIMSGIGPMCSGSSWIGIECLKEKCMAWGLCKSTEEIGCKLIEVGGMK